MTTIIHLDGNLILSRVRDNKYGFLDSRDITALTKTKSHRLFQVLLRFGSCRLICAVQDVEHIITGLENAGDYIRDVSIPAA